MSVHALCPHYCCLGCHLSAGGPTTTAASGPPADSLYADGYSSYGLSTPEIAGIVAASLGGLIALLSLGALAVGHYRRKTRGCARAAAPALLSGLFAAPELRWARLARFCCARAEVTPLRPIVTLPPGLSLLPWSCSKRFERFEDSPAAAAGASTAGPGLPPQLSIQLSNGKSMSLASSPDALPTYHSVLSNVSTQAASSTASGVPRLPTANSGMPLLPASSSGVGGPPLAPRRTASGTTRGGVAIPAAGSPFASAAALEGGAEGGGEGTAAVVAAGSPGTGVTVQPGKAWASADQIGHCA